MNGDVLTWLLLASACVPGWYAWRATQFLGNSLSSWTRWVQRVAFSGLVFLGMFGIVAYAAWKFGAPLAIGLMGGEQLSRMAWLPPSLMIWAAWTYGVLRWNTRKESPHEKPSSTRLKQQ